LMQVVRLASETDFDGWRAAARRLRADGVGSREVLWTVEGATLFAPSPLDGGRAGDGDGDGGRASASVEERWSARAECELAGDGLPAPPSPTLPSSRGKREFSVPRDFLELAE